MITERVETRTSAGAWLPAMGTSVRIIRDARLHSVSLVPWSPFASACYTNPSPHHPSVQP